MMNGKPCCPECANGTKFCPGNSVVDWIGPPPAPLAPASSEPITLLDAAIECRVKEYDAKVAKSLRIV